ncbi:MAG TPA: methyltransferase [Vicinamibacterales bacterium]|nr:methyltransferase [Vicinamibacterales bacterium]
MSLALTRTQTAYRVEPERSRPRAARRDYGELAAKVFILTLFSAMATAIAQDFAQTGHVTGLLLLVSEALVVALTLIRRTAAVVDRSWKARILTAFATFGPPLVRPAGVAVAPEFLTIAISACGLMIVVFGKLSLGRSFGLTPANRGVVSTGMYRVVRHPIYLGYLITHLGFIIANPAGWNLSVLVVADVALMLRAMCEEKTLALDPEYRAYMDRVRWRIVPGVF